MAITNYKGGDYMEKIKEESNVLVSEEEELREIEEFLQCITTECCW